MKLIIMQNFCIYFNLFLYVDAIDKVKTYIRHYDI